MAGQVADKRRTLNLGNPPRNKDTDVSSLINEIALQTACFPQGTFEQVTHKVIVEDCVIIHNLKS